MLKQKNIFFYFLFDINNYIVFIDYKKTIIIINLLIIYHNLKSNTIPFRTNPKISIFLPIFNKKKYIEKAIKSIQKQSLKEIEIIAVNDFSNDSSLKILNFFSSKDKRIKIINNTSNYGLLYSRAMGILHSTGEYLINLDPDDELYDSDALKYLYNKAIISDADIISFSYILRTKKKGINLCRDFNNIIRQPKLFESIFDNNNVLIDYLIWNKLIKKEVFLKAYKLFHYYIYYKKWNYHEDNIWSILVHKIASSKLCVNKIIYNYNNEENQDSLMKKSGSMIECYNLIYRFDMIRKIFNNSTYNKYINYECRFLINSIYFSDKFKKNIELNKDLKKLSFSDLKICMNNYNITKNSKKYIIEIIKTFDKREL